MNINRLLSRFILNKTENEENETLNQWKNESEENLKALRQIVSLNKTSDQLAGYKKTNPEEAWKKFEKRMAPETKPASVSYLRYAVAAAAVLFLGLFAYRYLFLSTETTHQATTFQASEIRKVSLHDGTVITLDKGSTLAENGTRNVTLKGRAYFDVAPDKNRPFLVKLDHGYVTVLGTEFNITTSQERTEVYVTEGRVKYTYQSDNIILNPGDVAEVNEGVLNLRKSQHKPEGWINRILKFENESLVSTMQQIAAYYDLRLEIPAQTTPDKCRINTSFNDENLEDVLKEIKMLTGLEYEIKNRTIIVRSFKC